MRYLLRNVTNSSSRLRSTSWRKNILSTSLAKKRVLLRKTLTRRQCRCYWLLRVPSRLIPKSPWMRLHPKLTIARIIMNSRFQRTQSTRTIIRIFRISTTPWEPPGRCQQASTRLRNFSQRQLLTLLRYLRMTTNVSCQSSASRPH